MSPALFAGVERGGEFAKAYGVEKNGSLWEVYPEMTSATQAASTTRRSGRIPTRDETHRGILPEAAVSGIAHISGPTRFSIMGPPDFRDRLTQVLHGGDRLQLCRTKTSRKWWPRERRSPGGPEALSG